MINDNNKYRKDNGPTVYIMNKEGKKTKAKVMILYEIMQDTPNDQVKRNRNRKDDDKVAAFKWHTCKLLHLR